MQKAKEAELITNELAKEAQSEVLQLKRKLTKAYKAKEAEAAKVFKVEECSRVEVNDLKKNVAIREEALKKSNLENAIKEQAKNDLEKKLKLEVEHHAELTKQVEELKEKIKKEKVSSEFNKDELVILID